MRMAVRAAGVEIATRKSLLDDLRRIGIAPGDTLLVHASMRRIGWVCGGATAMVYALRDAVGPAGTIAAPAQTLENRDPSRWSHAPVPEPWWPVVREHLPAYDPTITPSVGMGAVAERIRTWPGAARSDHPLTSFAAVGRLAGDLMAGHTITSPLGDESPLAGLERADARVLLLGVGFDRCTAFHLAEYRLPGRATRLFASVMPTPAGREWIMYEAVDLDDRDFPALGAAFEAHSGSVRHGRVGAATSRLFPLREAVRFATQWIPRHRQPRPEPGAREESEKR